jgi:integrase/recombinase XerD
MTTEAITPLRKRMIEDMDARKLCAGTQRGHIRACKRFAAFLKRSPDTATLMISGAFSCTSLRQA